MFHITERRLENTLRYWGLKRRFRDCESDRLLSTEQHPPMLIDIEKTGVRRFKVASGEIREYPVGEAYIEIEGLGATSVVVFGPGEAAFLLGVTSLELLGLQVDPLAGRLKPLELLL